MDVLRSHIHSAVLESEKIQYLRQISRFAELGKLSLYYGILSTALLLATVTWGVVGVVKLIQARQNHRKLEESSNAFYEGATHDALTKLPNRRLFNDRLGQTIAATGRSGRHAALIFLDLDNFKPLNDTHGHHAGDLLLIEAAERLRSCVREVDSVARFGGDEFVVLLCELDFSPQESHTQVIVIAEKILSTLSAPYPLAVNQRGHIPKIIQHQCTASLGVAMFSGHARSQQEILDQADLAMYRAKSEGRNAVCFYQPDFTKD
jgi:diguanylate cyclase (GGDEF)-like protein